MTNDQISKMFDDLLDDLKTFNKNCEERKREFEAQKQINIMIAEELLMQEIPEATEEEIKIVSEACWKNGWNAVIMYKVLKKAGKL